VKACVRKHIGQPFRVSQRKRELDYVPLLGEMIRKHVRKNAPDGRSVCRRDNTSCRMSALTQYPPKLCYPKFGVWEELKSKLTYDRIETLILERQRFAVSRDRAKQWIAQSLTRGLKHGDRDVRAKHRVGTADSSADTHRRFAGPGGHVEHTAPWFDFGGGEHGRNKRPRPSPSPTVVGQRIDRLSDTRVEAPPQTLCSSRTLRALISYVEVGKNACLLSICNSVWAAN